MAAINLPFAASATKRAPDTDELANGFGCGPADIELFNWLAWRSTGEAAAVITKSGLTPDDTDLTQFAKAIRSQALNYVATVGGTANALTATLDPAPTSLAELVGTPIRLKVASSNTSPTVTLNLNGLGAIGLRTIGGLQPSIRAWDVNDVVEVVYNGTNFVLSGTARGLAYTRLSANLTVYVNSSTGSNANDGLTAGSAFQTIQYAADFVQRRYDLAGFIVTISIAGGSYSAGATVAGPFQGATGPSSVVFQHNGGTLTATNSSCYTSQYGAQFTVQGAIALTATGAGGGQGCGLQCNTGYIQFSGVTFSSCARSHIFAGNAGFVVCLGAYTIAGNAQTHINVGAFGIVQIFNYVITLTGSPAFTSAFAVVIQGYADLSANVFSGAATGFRYTVDSWGYLYTGGAGGSYLPGSGAGTATAFGRYN